MFISYPNFVKKLCCKCQKIVIGLKKFLYLRTDLHRHHAFDGIAFFKLPRRIICADGPFDFGLYSLDGVIDALDLLGQN